MTILGLKTISKKSCCEFTPEGNKFFSFKNDDITVFLELYQEDFFKKGFFTIWKGNKNMFNGNGNKHDLLDDILSGLDIIFKKSNETK